MKQRSEPESYLSDIIYGFAHQIEEMIWQMNWRGVNITANKTDYFTRIVTGKCDNICSPEETGRSLSFCNFDHYVVTRVVKFITLS